MAEVLSQSQIDALLNAARSGEMDLDAPALEPEKKYKKYDFYSPRKFTKERIKMLNSIFEGYARVINSRINALLHTTCEIEVESIEEQRYNEFSNALTESDVLALAKIDQEQLQEESPILVHLDTEIVLTMVDRMMGGDGAPDSNLATDYKMTDLELNMYEDIIGSLIELLGGSWENYIGLKFEYVRTEVNPTLVLPVVMLTNIFAEIGKSTARHVTGEDKSDEIFGSLRESDLEIVAELARTRLLLSDLYHLNVGDVVDIKQPKDSPIFLNIDGRRWFDGRMGVHNKQKAVKIGETYIKA